MALTGVHILCSRVATRAGAVLPISPDWSETQTSAGITSKAAVDGNTLFQVSAGAADIYFAIGANPDAGQALGAGQSARYFLTAGSTREVFGTNGDRVAWTPA